MFVASFKKIGVDYAEFVAFIATFFLECRLRTTLSRLVDDRDINTDRYMSYKRYAAIWKQIDSQGKGQNFTKRFWEMLEGALNDTLHDLFVPKNDEFVMRLAHDDDKHWYNETKKITNRALGEETKHKRARHVKDNAIGFVADVTVNVASGLPVNVRYRRTGESSATAFKEVSRFVFKFSDENSAPNLTGKVEIAADRGYWNTDTLVFCVGRLGAGVVGTIKRGMKWFPFTWGEKKRPDPAVCSGPGTASNISEDRKAQRRQEAQQGSPTYSDCTAKRSQQNCQHDPHNRSRPRQLRRLCFQLNKRL